MSRDLTADGAVRSDRLVPIVDAEAPAERLAMFRILTGGFSVAYLAIRLPVFLQLADRRSGFDGVGLAGVLSGPLPSGVVTVATLVTLAAGVAWTFGWRFRLTGPAFAMGVLALATYRSSWGQLLHFEHLIVLHLLIVAAAPATDAWSMDARRRRASGRPRVERPPTSYGWPLALAALVVVITYVIAGIAKLRYGGFEWIVGDTLRNHVAYSAARLDLLGGDPSPFAGWAVRNAWLWPFVAAASVVVELAAPVALLGGRIRTAWVIAAWLMHVGILAFMLVGFPYPLFLVAFAPFFRIERLWSDRPGRMRRPVVSRPSPS
jgi:hypothetical protein